MSQSASQFLAALCRAANGKEGVGKDPGDIAYAAQIPTEDYPDVLEELRLLGLIGYSLISNEYVALSSSGSQLCRDGPKPTKKTDA